MDNKHETDKKLEDFISAWTMECLLFELMHKNVERSVSEDMGAA